LRGLYGLKPAVLFLGMNTKTIRSVIYSILAIIAAFAFFIFVDSSGRRTAGERGTAQALARSALEAARYSSLQQTIPPPPPASDNLPPSRVRAEGAIMIVRNGDFQGVAEPPKSNMDMLTDMSGAGKRKIQPVALTDSDLDKKMVPIGEQPKKPSLTGFSVPGLGGAPAGGPGMITASVDYKLFTSSETWTAFSNSHKCGLVKADFLKENVLILVSLSDFPSGIFKITALERTAKEIVVRYRVDALAMSLENEAGAQQTYSSAVVPKYGRVRLEQVP